MISVFGLANTLLAKARIQKIDITPMKLQKLLYFVYKHYLQLTGEPLFAERFEAWRYGPVIATVYDEFKKYGSGKIKEPYRDQNNEAWFYDILDDNTNDSFVVSFNHIWKKYSEFSGIELSELTHKVGSAWYNALLNGKLLLEDDDIKNEEWY